MTCTRKTGIFMIRSFKDKEAKTIFEGNLSRKLPTDIQKIILRKLMMLNASNCINDLRIPPSNHLEQLSGNLRGKWSIRINDQYRIVFTLENQSDYYDIEIVDYH